MVSILAFYFDDLSSNPADYRNNLKFEKAKINEKLAGVGPSLNKLSNDLIYS